MFFNASDNIVYVYLGSVSTDTHIGKAANIKVSGKPVAEDVAACRYNDNAVFCISNTKVDGKGEENK